MKYILSLLLLCLGFAQAQIEPPANLKPYKVAGMSREQAGFKGRYNFSDLLSVGYRDARSIPANKARVDQLENLVDTGRLAKVKISYSSPSVMGYQFSGGSKITMGETVNFTGNWKYKPTAIPAGQTVYVYPDALGSEQYSWQDGALSDGTPTYSFIEYTWYKPVAYTICGNPIRGPNVVVRTHRFGVPIKRDVVKVPQAPVLIYVEEQVTEIKTTVEYAPSRLYVGGTDKTVVRTNREFKSIGYFELSFSKTGRIKCPNPYCVGEPPVLPPPPPPPGDDGGTPPNNDENKPPPMALVPITGPPVYIPSRAMFFA